MESAARDLVSEGPPPARHSLTERGSVADRLIVKGAREHNLRGVDLDLPATR